MTNEHESRIQALRQENADLIMQSDRARRKAERWGLVLVFGGLGISAVGVAIAAHGNNKQSDTDAKTAINETTPGAITIPYMELTLPEWLVTKPGETPVDLENPEAIAQRKRERTDAKDFQLTGDPNQVLYTISINQRGAGTPVEMDVTVGQTLKTAQALNLMEDSYVKEQAARFGSESARAR